MLAVLHASQLVTLIGPARARSGRELTELGIIADGGMLVENGRILKVGKSAEIAKLCRPRTEIIDANDCVVTPGFVDAHTHFVFAGDRLDDFEGRARGESYEQIAQRGGGIRTTVAATRAMTEDELFIPAKKRADWMLRNGTTTAEAKSGYGLTIADELKILRVIRRVGAETADHLEQTDADGIAALTTAQVQPVLLPGSVYALGAKKYPNARTMIDAGLAVILATDFNPGSSPTAAMPMILSLAVTQMKMSPAEAISAAIINAAASLNRAAEIGSLDL